MRLLTRFHAEIFSDADAPTGLNRAVDFREIVLRYDAELTAVAEEWAGRFARDSDPSSTYTCCFLDLLVVADKVDG
jgi:hypothetical protein